MEEIFFKSASKWIRIIPFCHMKRLLSSLIFAVARASQSRTSKLTIWADAVRRYVIMWMVFISTISRATFKRAVLFPLNWKWYKIAFRVGINFDRSGKLFVFEFDIRLTDPSTAWTTQRIEGGKKPKYSVNWLLNSCLLHIHQPWYQLANLQFPVEFILENIEVEMGWLHCFQVLGLTYD